VRQPKSLEVQWTTVNPGMSDWEPGTARLDEGQELKLTCVGDLPSEASCRVDLSPEAPNIARPEHRSPLKILHILDHSLPLQSGYAFRSQNILRAQRNKGWWPIGLTSPKHEMTWKGPSREKEQIDDFWYYRTGASDHAVPFAGELQLINSLAKRIEIVAKGERPDLLHAHSPVLNAIPALWVGYKLGIPVVYEVRAFWEDAMVDHRTCSQGSIKYRTVRSLETWACRHAAQTAVICDGLRDDLIRRGVPEEKLTIVFNGANPGHFRGRDPDLAVARNLGIVGKKVLGFIGSFNRYEGLDLLVRAVRELTADVVLLLVGGGEMEKELRNQIQQTNMQDRVILPGGIPHEEIPGIYSLIDVLIYPRYSIRLTELVTPLKPLESMAMGKPIIASDIGGHRELIRDGYTGVLFKAGDLSALMKTLNRVLDDPRLQNRLAVQALEWVRQNRSWEKTTSVYSEIYAKALGRYSAHARDV
jgi:PEP-CTERM/exosortase A-associated glycosyltransferase